MSNEKKLTFITVIIKTDHKKDTNEEFRKASVKGQFLNTAAVNHINPIDGSAYYNVRGLDAILKEHKKDGKYRLYFEQGNCWVDERPDRLDKHIIRIKKVELVEWRGEFNANPKNEEISIADVADEE